MAISDGFPEFVSGRIPIDGSGVVQPISGSITAESPALITESAALADTDELIIDCDGRAQVLAQISGTWLGTVSFEASVDGVTYFAHIGSDIEAASGQIDYLTSINGVFGFHTSGFKNIKLRHDGDGTTDVVMTAALHSGIVWQNQGIQFISPVGGVMLIDGSGVTQPISGTVTIQDGGNTITVDGTIASTQSGTWNVTNVSGTVSLPTGASTETTLSSINTKTPALGQATMANSRPVVLASNQSAIPATQSGTWNITNVSGTVSLPTGASTLAEQQIQTASLSVLDDWDETDRAKVNIIASQVGVQGGAGAVSANTQRVVIATDQTVIPVRGYTGTVTHTAAVAGSASAQVLATNSNRRYLCIQNNSGAAIWFRFGAIATAASPSITLGVNQSFIMEGNFISTQAINVIRTGILDLNFSIIEGV